MHMPTVNTIAPRVHRKSGFNVPEIKDPGYLPELRAGGKIAAVRTLTHQSFSFALKLRQLGLKFFDYDSGEPAMQITEIGGPELFWPSIGSDRLRSGWVMARYRGAPKAEDYRPLSASLSTSLAGGLRARINAEFGAERGIENIVAHRSEGRDIIISHVSQDTDRRLIIINPDGWNERKPQREALIRELDSLSITGIQRTEVSSDGTLLTVESNVLDRSGHPARREIDISCLKFNPRNVYHDPDDQELSVKLIEIDPLEDFECLEREHVTLFYNQAIEITEDAIVRGYRDEAGAAHVLIDPVVYHDLGYASVRAAALDGGERKISVRTSESTFEIRAVSEDAIRRHAAFSSLKHELQEAVLGAFQESAPIEDKAVETDPRVTRAMRKAVAAVIPHARELENFSVDRVTKMRSRYALQFYKTRETRFKDMLDTPLGDGESVLITKVKSAMEVVHLSEANGFKKGERSIIPLNFKVPPGMVRIDPRPHAVYNTIIVPGEYDTALAGQHLIDCYILWTEIMATVWPRVDQLGFFGIFMLAAMAFPHGNMFTDPKNNPWFLRSFGTVSHSIFDAKSDAGRLYYFFSGNPRLSLESVGAAMVTGPNTDSLNPAREGRLFPCRIPGRSSVVKTALPGFYITVIEDAQSSYFFKTMFGLKTATTILPLSAGGGVDNYQLALTIQRSQRWNAGEAIFTLDSAGNLLIDYERGGTFYRSYFNHTRGLWYAENNSVEKCVRGDALPAMLRPSENVKTTRGEIVRKLLDPKCPVPKMYKYEEAREWLNVGTWYHVSAAKLMAYLSVPILVLSTFLPIPVAAAGFIFACLAVTLFGWPFWAGQMAKVGVNPKTILSLSPVHLFWGDIPMHTMLKAGLDIERLSVGKFRISDRRLGNRIPARDKRTAFWVGAVLPTTLGLGLLGGAMLLSFGGALTSLLYASAPFIAGIIASRYLGRLIKRLLPNPKTKSFWRSLIQWTVKVAPFAAGTTTTLLIVPTLTLIPLPFSLALMAGIWSIFMGLNVLNEFRIYHREQRKNYALPEPNQPAATIKKYQADTWRNTLREAFGFTPPTLLPMEFTCNLDENIDPYKLYEAVNLAAPHLLARPHPQDALVNLNSLINGEGDPAMLFDLYEELKDYRPASLAEPRRKIARLLKKTQAAREQMRAQRSALELNLEPEQYDRIRELNRLVLEETFPEFCPRQEG
jgi:hypothetical protein